MKKKPAVNYISNKKLVQELIISKAQDELTDAASKMFILLANKAITKMYYSNPLDKQDCLQEALLIIFSNWRNFDPAKSNNAFAYITEIAKRGFAKGFNTLQQARKDNDGNRIVPRKIQILSSNDNNGLAQF